jgi:hypothetical protein
MKTMVKMGLILSVILMTACAAGSKATPEEKAALDKMVNEKQMEVRVLWAQPMASQGLNSIANAGLLPPGSTASRIDVSSSRGYLRMVGDTVMADLPYYGERRMGGGYNTRDVGIKFKGVPEEFTSEPMTKSDGYTLKFNINNGTEVFQVMAQLYPNQNALLTIASSHRTNIWYQGNLYPYEKKDGSR